MSSALYAADSLSFVQSSVAMLDVFFVFFMLLGFYLYWTERKTLAVLSLTTSTLCKLTGFFGFVVLMIMEMASGAEPRRLLRHLTLYAATTFLLFWGLLLGLQPKSEANPFSILLIGVKNIVYTPSSNAIVSISSLPWNWILNPQPITYYATHLPNLTYVKYVGMGNPAIWLLTIPSIAYVAWSSYYSRNKFRAFLLTWFAATYLLPWYPLALLTHRPLFIFYFLPTVGAVTVSLSIASMALLGTRIRKLAYCGLIVYGTIVAYFFILYFPIRIA
jgi:predicted membrane-bound dolichyl-phosphate-mannose-protein mannosyltransferase